MTRHHLKRLPAPQTWRVGKKKETYVTRPKPGAHSLDLGMSLDTVSKYVGLTETKAELKNILQNKNLQVDGKQRHDVKLPVGFMDVLSIPEDDIYYRIVMSSKGLEALEISEDEAKVKPVKITGKTKIKGGKTQIQTLDGRNITLDEDKYQVGDTLLIQIPSQEIEEHVKLEKGNKILLYKGRHAGEIGEVQDIERDKLTFKSGDEAFETRKEYAFVIGEDEPIIEL